jgi:hypothetical protein
MQTVLFMKVDAQGHDFRVLQGADKLLTEQRVLVLLVEFAPTLMPVCVCACMCVCMYVYMHS